MDFRLTEKEKYQDGSVMKVGAVGEKKIFISSDQWSYMVFKLLVVFCSFHLTLRFVDQTCDKYCHISKNDFFIKF